MPVPFLSSEIIEAEANAFLHQYHPSETAPTPIEEIVDNILKINIVPVPSLHAAYDIDGFITSDLTEIKVDEYVYCDRPNRYRFTLAHEIGHSVLHSSFYEGASFSTVAECREFLDSLSGPDYNALEVQANMFASMVLMPATVVQNHFDQQLTLIPQDLQAKLGESSIIDTIGQVLAPEFQVSPEALKYRMTKLQLLS